MITRILVGKDRYFYQYDSKNVNTQYGQVVAEAINNAKDGEQVLSNRYEKFVVISPSWLDIYKKLERGPQLMTLKDLGYIAAETGIGPDSIVGEAGTGTGAAAIYFARLCKQVYSFDIEEKHLELGKKNAATLGISNITFQQQDIYYDIQDHQYDLFLLDNPEPWKALEHYKIVKIGGYIASYTPTIIQAAQFVDSLPEALQHRKTIELIEREWHSEGQRIRPSSEAIGHTGFIVIVRRIK